MADLVRGGDLLDPRRNLNLKHAESRDERILRDCLKATGGNLQTACDQAHIMVWQAEIDILEAAANKNQPLIDAYTRCIESCKADSERRKAREGK